MQGRNDENLLLNIILEAQEGLQRMGCSIENCTSDSFLDQHCLCFGQTLLILVLEWVLLIRFHRGWQRLQETRALMCHKQLFLSLHLELCTGSQKLWFTDFSWTLLMSLEREVLCCTHHICKLNWGQWSPFQEGQIIQGLSIGMVGETRTEMGIIYF